MALEEPLNKKKGNRLGATEINEISAVTARVSKFYNDGSTILKDFQYNRPVKDRSLQVVEIMDVYDETIDGVFLCGIRFYDTEAMEHGIDNDGEWLTDKRADPDEDTFDENAQYILDSRGLSSSPSVGDKLSAWWDIESQSFIPLVPGIRHAWGKTTAHVAKTDSSFTVSNVIPFDGSEWPGEGDLTVKNDGYHIASGQTGKLVYCYDGAGSSPVPGHNYDGSVGTDGWNWHPYDFAPLCDDHTSP